MQHCPPRVRFPLLPPLNILAALHYAPNRLRRCTFRTRTCARAPTAFARIAFPAIRCTAPLRAPPSARRSFLFCLLAFPRCIYGTPAAYTHTFTAPRASLAAFPRTPTLCTALPHRFASPCSAPAAPLPYTPLRARTRYFAHTAFFTHPTPPTHTHRHAHHTPHSHTATTRSIPRPRRRACLTPFCVSRSFTRAAASFVFTILRVVSTSHHGLSLINVTADVLVSSCGCTAMPPTRMGFRFAADIRGCHSLSVWQRLALTSRIYWIIRRGVTRAYSLGLRSWRRQHRTSNNEANIMAAR